MLSKSDIKKLVEVFATKGELKVELKQIREEMATKDQNNKVMDKLDAVYGELKDFRQEQTVHTEQHRQIREELDNVEVRLDKVEQAV